MKGNNRMSLRQRQPRIKNDRHLNLIRRLPCIICFRAAPSEAAHVRYGDPTQGKPSTGVAEKPSDRWTVPLCAEHHRTGPDAQHGSGERKWWERHGIDPIPLCEALWRCSTQEQIEEAFFLHCFGRESVW